MRYVPQELQIEQVMRDLGLDYIQARNHVLQREHLARTLRQPSEARRHDKRSDFGSTVPGQLR